MRVSNLCKTYPTRFGENMVLDGVNFELKMGERLGILGRNGAGKSTMVRLISGAERPTSGTIETSMSVSWPLAFGGAFQHNLTGLDNVRFISRIYDQNAEKNLAFVEDFAELGPYIREEVRTYSSGMRARLAFAISMIIEFDCFLIDEVGAVGDARFHERCNRELFQKRGDRAMVIISHDASYVRDHCNRFGVLHNGKLALFDDFEEAYGDFRRKIGLEAANEPAFETVPVDRSHLIEASQNAAILDDAFRAAAQEADWKRDEGEWTAAEDAYGQALALYPYQRSYWVQKGHCAKEAGADDRAEIAYRSAIALGEPISDVRQHLDFVLERQGQPAHDGRSQVYCAVPAKDQPPAAPDIALFARSLWNTSEPLQSDYLVLLRTSQNCDQLLAAMIEDTRFSSALSGTVNIPDRSLDQYPDPFADNLVAIACASLAPARKTELTQIIRGSIDPLKDILDADGFAGWTQSQAAFQRAKKYSKASVLKEAQQ